MTGPHSYHQAQGSLASQVGGQYFYSKKDIDYLHVSDYLVCVSESLTDLRRETRPRIHVASPHVNTKIQANLLKMSPIQSTLTKVSSCYLQCKSEFTLQAAREFFI